MTNFKEEFEDKYKQSVFEAYPEYTDSHTILLNDIADWWLSKIELLLAEKVKAVEEIIDLAFEDMGETYCAKDDHLNAEIIKDLKKIIEILKK